MSLMMKTLKVAPALAVGITMFAMTPSYSAGEGTTTTKPAPSCKKGKMWDKKKKKCVKVKKESNLSDDNLYQVAKDFAYNKRYEDALEVLNLAANQNDPRILNYKGFSTRKLGNVEAGLVYYQAAIKADPTYTLAREYMGEAFLQLGKVDKAVEQLDAIKSICGTNCREYALLDEQIKAFVAKS